ncbi:hypothetical protein [Streptomyces aidingensis]|uniref:Lipoprotein n=1 Tax=Streptomyces aidingensis TaxID=910347 RepID=A0A1I1HKU4_9ACTN|nr:hypothetical protein [Streptomyces aidingensis]SFC24446.1 hypothetical protein SAMN05421773_102425 [Streptomyces aidingensis]
MTVPRPRRPTAALLATLLAATAGCAGPFGADGGVRVEGAAPTARPHTGPVYVSDPAAQPLRRPERFGITEFVSLSRLRWESWDEPVAFAEGMVAGTWCLPDCLAEPYPATVELRDPVPVEAVYYYSRATVRSPDLPAELAGELLDFPLNIPYQE